jgi:hypothetical protein
MLDNAHHQPDVPLRDAVDATAAVDPRELIIEVPPAGSSTTNDPSGTDQGTTSGH